MRVKTYMVALAAVLMSTLFATSPKVTWYVDASASAGGNGLTQSLAFRTIAEAISAASSGDTVSIAAGTYKENVVIEGKSITVVGAGRDATIIDADESGRPLYLKGADVTGTRVKSLALVNGRADVGGGLYVDTAGVDVGFTDGKIMDCVTTGNGAAVNGPAWVVRTLIGRCWSTGDEMAVFTGVGGLFSSVIIGCGHNLVVPASGWSDWSRNHSPILDTYSSGDQIKVVNCTFSNNEGILTRYVSSSFSSLVIRNSAFFGVPKNWMRQPMNLQYCFGARGGVLPNYKNNIGGDNPSTHAGERWPSTHFQVVAPFSDWRPLAGSDLLESGNSGFVTDLVPEEYRATDYYGNARVQGDSVDIGAAEGSVDAAGGIVFFPVSASDTVFSCATNLWINGYRAVSPDNLSTSGNPTWANGIHFASTETPRAATLEFNYFADRSLALWGAKSQAGTATHPNCKGVMTFVIPGTPGEIESNTLVRAASIRWVSPDGNDTAAGTTSDAPFRTLQGAVADSEDYGVVFAKPGTYAEGENKGASDTDNVNTTSNRLYFTKQLYIVSTDGPETTVIMGKRATGSGTYDGCGPGAMRCVQYYNPSGKACVCGFTLTGGATDASPIGQAKEGKTGNSWERGNFAGSAAQGHTFGRPYDSLQLVDCIVSNNVSYFGSIYSVVAKGCIFTDNRIVTDDSSGTNVTSACGPLGTRSKFFSCLAHDNDPNRTLTYDSFIYDSTFARERAIGGTIYNTAYIDITTAPSSKSGVVEATRYDFADMDNGDWRPVPGSALFSSASSDILQTNYVKYGTVSLDGIAYTPESGQPLAVGAYRGASANPDTVRDWYVNPEMSDDSGDGLTPQTAKRTLAAVMALVGRGDTVHAAAGTYGEGVMTNTVNHINSSDTTNVPSRVVVPENVTLVSDEGPEVTFIVGALTASGYNYTGEDSIRGAYLMPGAVLEGFTVTNCATMGGAQVHEYNCGACVAAPPATGSNTAIIRNCRLTDGHARSGAAAYGGILERCRIDNCKHNSDGITFRSELDNCSLVAEWSSALREYRAVRNSTIYVEVESGDPDFTPGVTGAPIENSIIFYSDIRKASTLKNATNCIICATKTNLTIDNTCGGLIEATAIGGVLDLTTYRPLAASPAVNAGDMELFNANPSSVDCGGGQRVYGSKVDIGAYEYTPFSEMGAALAGRDIEVVAVDEDASLDGGVLLTDGAMVVTWQKKSANAVAVITFEVTGGGVLVAADETGELGRYQANGVQTLNWKPAGVGTKTISFTYQPADNESAGTGAVIKEIRNVTGFYVIIR